VRNMVVPLERKLEPTELRDDWGRLLFSVAHVLYPDAGFVSIALRREATASGQFGIRSLDRKETLALIDALQVHLAQLPNGR